jgi:hypothetical protein
MRASRPSEMAGDYRRSGKKRPRIFVIGPNKCGTTSFHRMFAQNKIASAHYRYKKRSVALMMMNNLALARHPFAGFDDVEAFSDLNHFERGLVYIEGARFFREIHRFEPDAYFILNTRDIDRWIVSRVNHGLDVPMAAVTGLEVDAVLDHWRTLFKTHHDEVRSYFAGNPRFLEFNIETHDIATVVEHLAPDYSIDPATWGQHFSTAERQRSAKEAEAASPC